jgi:Tc5 transposase DNA-binding domain
MPKIGVEQEARIKRALEDLETGKIRYIREASRVHDVPYSTLASRRTGRPSRYTSHIQQQICTEVEERSLNNWIQRWTAQGFTVRHDLLRMMAEHLILSCMDENRRRTISTHILGKNWTTRFVKRYSNLKTIITKPIERSRQLACTTESFNKWFNTFRDHMQQYKPDLEDIYNVDETGFAMGSTAWMYSIVDRYQIGTGYQGCGARGEWITAVECVSVAGKVLPPLIIFKGKYLQST